MSDPVAELTKIELRALCDVAARAWATAPRGADRVTFSWGGARYVVSHAASQLQVSKLDGTPVASRQD